MLRSSGHTIAAGLTEEVSISKGGRPVCLELYKDNKELGRFMLRSSGHTIAAGLTEGVRISKRKTDMHSSRTLCPISCACMCQKL